MYFMPSFSLTSILTPDVVTIEKSGDAFRLLYDTKGRYVLQPVTGEETTVRHGHSTASHVTLLMCVNSHSHFVLQFKLCRVAKQSVTSKAVPYIVTHDGRTIRYADPSIKVGDSLKIDLATGKVLDIFKFEIGAVCVITQGRNTGRVGVLLSRDRHPGSFDIVHLRDKEGNEFATRLGNVFILGKGESPAIKLPAGSGIKRTIFEQRQKRINAQ